MKKIVFLAILIVIYYANAEIIIQKYNFEEPQIIRGKGDYSKILSPKCLNLADEGNPNLPRYGSKLILAQGEDIVSIRVLEKKFYPTLKNIKIEPAGKQIPFSKMAQYKNYKLWENEEIYASKTKFPKNDISKFGTAYKNGHSIGYFNFSSVEYYPAQNKINPLKEISFEIITEPSARATQALKFLRGTKNITDQISSLVDNPGKLNSYRYAKKENKNETYDLLLITTEDLAEYYQDYLLYKNKTGYRTKVITREEIEANFEGNDLQEKIRNAIIDAYQNNNISFVILGGDSDPTDEIKNRIPHRGFYDNSYFTDDDIPSDLYYAALDGNWNENENELFGEAGEEDFLSEIAIGRICGDNEAEIKNQLYKLYMYQAEPVIDDTENNLFIGELLWSQSGTFGGTYMDELIEGSSLWGYTTGGISENITPYKLYEKDGIWDKNNIYDMFNNSGINLLSHLGHSNVTYNMKLHNEDVNEHNFSNDGINRGFVIGYSQGCYCGSFDSRTSTTGEYKTEDCIAEKLTGIKTAEAAMIANSRFGLGMHGSTNGASQYFHRQFIDALYGENISLIGLTNQDSKEDNLPFINKMGIKWCYYELNLFGDPTMDIWTAAPSALICTYPESVILGETTSLEISTDTPLAKVTLFQSGSILASGLTGENGNIIFEFENPISNNSEMLLTIIAHNTKQFEAFIYPVNDTPLIIYKKHKVDDSAANNNGQADCNETIKLDFTIKNIGFKTATDVQAKLSSADEFVTILDNSEAYGNITGNTEKTKKKAFKIDLAANISNKHQVKFKIEFFSKGEKLSESNFKIMINAPVINLMSLNVADENGIIEPGENSNLKLMIQNIGNFPAEDIEISLESQNDKLEILENNITIDYLGVDSSKAILFNYETSPELEMGEEVAISVDINNNSYNSTKEYTFIAGVTEDFGNGFANNDWSFEGTPWVTDSSTKVIGKYSAKSGVETGAMILNSSISENGYISFYRKTAFGSSFDKLNFMIDNQPICSWKDDFPWKEVRLYIEAGSHTFKWEYQKDWNSENEDNCAWIDYILIYRKSLDIEENEAVIPKATTLYQNYPNPFNPQTTIKFYNSELGKVNLSIFNVKGQKVATLIDRKLTKGMHKVTLNAISFNSGVYFYSLKTKDNVFTKKMILVK